MAHILGAQDLSMGNVAFARKDVTAADLQDQDEAGNDARDRYQRLFWEPLSENEVLSASPDRLRLALTNTPRSLLFRVL